MMDLNRLTEKAQEAILAAQRLATDANSTILDAEHILVCLSGRGDKDLAEVLSHR